MKQLRQAPELLAPAGDWDCVRAAVENGADAVYFGLDCGFNARERAKNFAVSDLPELIEFVHRRGVKAYVTLNTLAFPSELAEVEQLVRKIAEAGVDAVLVQDIGVARLVRSICPDLGIHASTQMTLTSSECIQVAEELGIERVVLARELSIPEIRKIHDQTAMPLEVFVHGALCVAYSGQCLTSESLGGRSANRGQCAQACRLAYDLICDGEDVDLERVRYLLSPQDLAAYELTPELIEAGVCSFKIEGRLKTPEYVANITCHYRQAIDKAIEGTPVHFSRRDVQEMELSFSRGFSPGWLQGCDHKMLVPGLSSAKRGVLLGTVCGKSGDRVSVELQCSISRGDGIVFEGDRENDDEQGGRVYQVYADERKMDEAVESGVVELTFNWEAMDLRRIYVGQRIWKTDDPQLTKKLRASFSQADAVKRVGLDLNVMAKVGQPLRIQGETTNGLKCQVASGEPLEVATRHPVTKEVLQKQLGRLGGTVYELRQLDAKIAGNPMVPLSVLGKLRHELIEQLDSGSVKSERHIAAEAILPQLTRSVSATPATDTEPRLRVLCRTLEQLQSTVEHGVGEVYVDFQDIREYGEAVTIAHAAKSLIYIATPRIQKPDELGIFRVLMRHGADGILVRNLAGMEFYRQEGVPFVADFSLNVANELTAQFLIDRGARRVTASYDLNRDQLLDLVAAVPASWLEIVIHQHMPMFHMEHCVFCAVMSPGTNKTNCGRPCDIHEVKLRDRIGKEHLLTADVGCRNTLFNATPQSAAEAVPALLAKGIRDFRIELLSDDDTSIGRMLTLYRDLVADRVTAGDVWKQLQASNRVGVTRGTLEERRNPLAII
ncbi:MAG: U32 family peptidase [Planctomycetaceae bacterium]|nr:U32 family peptidase [Planctomycetales bacterium]MCB9941846.1 U32 family peptidase [Planctomycetaceae bacterium]